VKLYNILVKYKKKTITKSELEELSGLYSDESLFNAVKECVDKGLLLPILSSKTNGNKKFPVYEKYKILREEPDFQKEIDQILCLHPLLQKDGFLQRKPEYFAKYKNELLKLSKYLFTRNSHLVPISRKERSFELCKPLWIQSQVWC
jgi:hypothetical protein